MGTVARIVEGLTCPKCQASGFAICFFEREGWKSKCPQCGSVVTPEDKAGTRTRFYGNRRFAGSERESLAQGFHPSEVAHARQHIDAGTIRDDGTVAFDDRHQEQRFQRQYRDYCDRFGGTEEEPLVKRVHREAESMVEDD